MLINSKVVKFRYWVGLRNVEYGMKCDLFYENAYRTAYVVLT